MNRLFIIFEINSCGKPSL